MAGNRKAAETISPFKKQGIYVIQDMTAGKGYIGSSVELTKRLRKHENDLKKDTHSNWHLQRAYNKQHDLCVTVIPVSEGNDIRQIEQKLIDEYFDSGILYNIAKDVASSRLGLTTSEETKKLQSNIAKEQYASGQRINPWCGKKHSDETKQKISTSKLGTKHSDETKQKLSNILIGNQRTLGHKQSEEVKQKRADSNRGKTRSVESRQNIINGIINSKTEIYKIAGKEYLTYSEIAKDHDINTQTAINRINSSTVRFKDWERVSK